MVEWVDMLGVPAVGEDIGMLEFHWVDVKTVVLKLYERRSRLGFEGNRRCYGPRNHVDVVDIQKTTKQTSIARYPNVVSLGHILDSLFLFLVAFHSGSASDVNLIDAYVAGEVMFLMQRLVHLRTSVEFAHQSSSSTES